MPDAVKLRNHLHCQGLSLGSPRWLRDASKSWPAIPGPYDSVRSRIFRRRPPWTSASGHAAHRAWGTERRRDSSRLREAISARVADDRPRTDRHHGRDEDCSTSLRRRRPRRPQASGGVGPGRSDRRPSDQFAAVPGRSRISGQSSSGSPASSGGRITPAAMSSSNRIERHTSSAVIFPIGSPYKCSRPSRRAGLREAGRTRSARWFAHA